MNAIMDHIKEGALYVEDPEFLMLIIVRNVLSKKKMYNILKFQRDGCPKIINLGCARTDLFYERKKYGFKQR